MGDGRVSGLGQVSLDDKYLRDDGRVFLTGVQALVRLALVQRRRDVAAGLDTAGYVTGYRGSPLGAYDTQLRAAAAHLEAHRVLHRPAVNEDLAATACQGTQQVGLRGEATCDGVFAIWYGKGPGVDRSGDAVRHGNLFGAARHGGVLMLLGDDHAGESSTTAHQSDYAMVDAMVPVLSPSGVAELLEFGLLGIAMSRFSGAWVSMKCVHDTVECTASIEVSADRPEIVLPAEDEIGPGRRDNDLDTTRLLSVVAGELERRLHTVKMEAARAFARANGIDRLVTGAAGDGARIGVVASGKAYLDVRTALAALGIDDARAAARGLRVYKVGMVFPLEPQGLERAARGLETLIVVEEKRGLIEAQVRELLYAGDVRPVVIGKADEVGAPLFPSFGVLDVNRVAVVIGERLAAATGDAALLERVAAIRAAASAHAGFEPAMARLPWYCPGCPHNISTVVPEGSRAVAGIGCHTMVTWMNRDTFSFTQMGGEGASWLGEAPFTTTGHVFQNIGDGTFFHSGSLAVRAAVASGENVTFKLLYNDAVALTGGQKMETAGLTVPRICRMMEAEGVAEVVVVTDEPGKYPIASGFPHGVRIHHRDDLASVQERLRSVPGVTMLIYDQTCAAEKRRRRKRGTLAEPDERVFVNEMVCEGCGDCGVQSNCVAIQPVETPFGRKRQIDQSACNRDFSCLKGFCPSFVTVRGGRLRRRRAKADEAFAALPEPGVAAIDGSFSILVTGIGGTGVVTIGALLGMAAHLEGKGCAGVDMVGLAQKGGAVVSHLKIAAEPGAVLTPRIAAGAADLVLGCDLLVAAGRQAVPVMARGRTRVVLNDAAVTTGAFTADPDLAFPGARLIGDVEAAAQEVARFDARGLAVRLLGDAIGANLMVVGFAAQKGWLPLSVAALERAIEINGVAVDAGKAALAWGRLAAHDPAAVLPEGGDEHEEPATLEGEIDRRAAFLTDYQDAAYAGRYRSVVARVRAAEARLAEPGDGEVLGWTVMRRLFALMAVKDEYEVARLYTDGGFRASLEATFEHVDRLEVHLAPPWLSAVDPRTGRPVKKRYGPWIFPVFRVLARARRWRGSALDPFARQAERRLERRLLADYRETVEEVVAGLTAENRERAAAWLDWPRTVRGFGPVKAANAGRARLLRERLRADFRREAPAGAEVTAAR
ncbi:MAG: indolepyruvate ferredoxin oxidoreductase family protein [Geminicoccaceae bacterium]|nr:indolepyruvate ferredoxin oxidoreductase family protein [Geminicoccaceae bacterium]